MSQRKQGRYFEARMAAIVLGMILVPLAALALIVNQLFWIPFIFVSVLGPGALLVARDHTRLRERREAERQHEQDLIDRAAYLEELLAQLPEEDREHARQMIAEREVQSERAAGHQAGYEQGFQEGARSAAQQMRPSLPNLRGWGVPLAAMGAMGVMGAMHHHAEAERHQQWEDWMQVRNSYLLSGQDVPSWVEGQHPWGTDESGFYRN